MNFQDVISKLNRCGVDTIKPGLERMVSACARLGNPERAFKSVHVAGTNGKGSTIAFLESILRAAGCTVGRYTSPHLHDVRERMAINGQMILEMEFVRAYETVQEKCADLQPSYFETLTLMAFVYFRDHPVDVVLLETGLGGRWDATNVVTPLVSVLTTIDYDHQAYLGETLTQITAEKCGILKPTVPAVIAAQSPEAMDVIQHTVAELEIHAQIVQPLAADIELGLPGDHQRQNAALAVVTARILSELRFPIRDFFVPLAQTNWPGRLEWISKDPPILCDVAHNPGGMQVLTDYTRTLVSAHDETDIVTGDATGWAPVAAIAETGFPTAAGPVTIPRRGISAAPEPVTLVFGVMCDKDAVGMVRVLAEIADTFYCVTPNTPRALPAADLAQIVRAAGKTAVVTTIADMKKNWKGPGLLVVTGSFYTVGEFRFLTR